jgi:CHAT domain-containing protein/Tfp pilus assembly protein PilF
VDLPRSISLLGAIVMAFAIVLSVPAIAADDPLVEARTLNQIALALYRQGHYAEAQKLGQRALAIREKALGPEHPDVAESLNNLAAINQRQANPVEAEALYKRALAIREKALGPGDPAVAVSHNNLAALYYSQTRYDEAEPHYKRALEIREKALGSEHLDVARSLNSLATLYERQGRYAEAQWLCERALAVREKALGPEHPEVAESLNNLGVLHKMQGSYSAAERLYKQAMAIREKAFGPEHPDVGQTVDNLAELYRVQARYSEAELLYKRAITIREKGLGPDHPDVARNLNNLAVLYQDQGRYADAEPLHQRALAIKEKVFGPEHPDVATTLTNLAALYRVQGRYAEAEPLYRRALAIKEKVFGPDHPDVALSRDNLAVFYHERGRYAEAEELHKQALRGWETVLGPNHPDVAISLTNLAALYQDQHRYAEAEGLYRRALAIQEAALGSDHPNLATSLNNLAELCKTQGRYTEAEPLYDRSLIIREKTLGHDHPYVAESLNNLALLYFAQGRLAEALSTSDRAVKILAEHLSKSPLQRSAAAIAEQRKVRGYFLNYIEIADALSKNAPDRGSTTADDTFRVEQLAQASTTASTIAGMAARFSAGTDTLAELVRERQDLAILREQLDAKIIRVASLPPAGRRSENVAGLHASVKETNHKLDTLDAKIAQEFPNFAELSSPKPLSAATTESLLAPDEALIVYLTGGKRTSLWIVRRDNIRFLRLDIDAKALSIEVRALRSNLDPELNEDLAPFPARRAYALFQKLLEPAADALAGAHHLLIVPDGSLQSLPMGVLVTRLADHDPKTLADHRDIPWLARDYAMTVLPSISSLQALRRPRTMTSPSMTFLGVGNPVLEGASGTERGKLAPLPETADELRKIAHVLGAEDQDLLLGERATEPMVRQKPLNQYGIVDFATHGLLSGELPGLAEPALVLTPPAVATPEDDGLLTASKIATLKLNADWVVLSACNTAAGDGTPDGGGLSGLAKAFFYAGARSLLVSHWYVRSEETVNLITGAFAELTKNPAIGHAEALRRSMMAMLDPVNPAEFAHPQAWAPFVVAGEGAAGR